MGESQQRRIATACGMLGAALTVGVAAQTTAPTRLPAPSLAGPMALEQALQQRRSVRDFADQPIALADLAQLLWAAQGTTGPQGRRTAPSAGALYPLELLVVAGRVEKLAPGVYRYLPAAHALAPVRGGDLRADLGGAVPGQGWIAGAPVVIVVAAVPERTAAKYGARSTRYVAIEAGHAAQNVALQAAAYGLGTTYVGAFDDAQVGRVLKLAPGTVVLGLLPVGHPR